MLNLLSFGHSRALRRRRWPNLSAERRREIERERRQTAAPLVMGVCMTNLQICNNSARGFEVGFSRATAVVATQLFFAHQQRSLDDTTFWERGESTLLCGLGCGVLFVLWVCLAALLSRLGAALCDSFGGRLQRQRAVEQTRRIVKLAA